MQELLSLRMQVDKVLNYVTDWCKSPMEGKNPLRRKW